MRVTMLRCGSVADVKVSRIAKLLSECRPFGERRRKREVGDGEHTVFERENTSRVGRKGGSQAVQTSKAVTV